MSLRSGRIEKRIQRAIPVEISSLQQLPAIEKASTENISSLGARVVSQRPHELNELVVIRSSSGQGPTEARVVYCHRLADGRFGIGMHFLREMANWFLEGSLGGSGKRTG